MQCCDWLNKIVAEKELGSCLDKYIYSFDKLGLSMFKMGSAASNLHWPAECFRKDSIVHYILTFEATLFTNIYIVHFHPRDSQLTYISLIGEVSSIFLPT